MNCRHCRSTLRLPLIDLGTSPPSNAYLRADELAAPERWFPLRVFVCEACWLVQTEDYAHHGDLFSADYAYFSSFSTSWLDHSRDYVGRMLGSLSLGRDSTVVEVASNDGYLLQYVKAHGVPCYGIEPTASTAAAARERGIETIEEFFGVALARTLVEAGRSADLTAANNVLAHVPDINDFVRGFATLLKPHGVSTFEFPHLARLLQHCQFDTIYHEHFSYLSLVAVMGIFAANGLSVFDVEELTTHGGSLRVHAQRSDSGRRVATPAVGRILEEEHALGLTRAEGYSGFQARAEAVKDRLLTFLIDAKSRGEVVGAYGAAAKGNTLLNFAGVRSDLVPWVVDRNPAKCGKFMPGSRIPIVDEAVLDRERPDHVLILPWNLADEVTAQLQRIRGWGGRFVTAIPTLSVR